jgi:hypothetical protein
LDRTCEQNACQRGGLTGCVRKPGSENTR